jgi:hypothetical protein
LPQIFNAKVSISPCSSKKLNTYVTFNGWSSDLYSKCLNPSYNHGGCPPEFGLEINHIYFLNDAEVTWLPQTLSAESILSHHGHQLNILLYG